MKKNFPPFLRRGILECFWFPGVVLPFKSMHYPISHLQANREYYCVAQALEKKEGREERVNCCINDPGSSEEHSSSSPQSQSQLFLPPSHTKFLPPLCPPAPVALFPSPFFLLVVAPPSPHLPPGRVVEEARFMSKMGTPDALTALS